MGSLLDSLILCTDIVCNSLMVTFNSFVMIVSRKQWQPLSLFVLATAAVLLSWMWHLCSLLVLDNILVLGRFVKLFAEFGDSGLLGWQRIVYLPTNLECVFSLALLCTALNDILQFDVIHLLCRMKLLTRTMMVLHYLLQSWFFKNWWKKIC